MTWLADRFIAGPATWGAPLRRGDRPDRRARSRVPRDNRGTSPTGRRARSPHRPAAAASAAIAAWRYRRARAPARSPARIARSASPTFWMPSRSCDLFLRQHLELDERAAERVVLRLDERGAADAEVDRRRPPAALVERLRPRQRFGILVDVEVAMRHTQPPQMPQRAAGILTPVGAVDCDHEIKN